MPIDTEVLAERYRVATIDVTNKRLLVTNFRGTEQEKDLTEAANCDGFGRIRHFRRKTSPGWPLNPLPIDPARAALRLGPQDEIRAQVFQNAACNWRCWYCFVPFNLLSADPAHSTWLSPSELFQLFLKEDDRPLILDLSGGQPELVPEWTYWMIEEIERNGLRGQVYLWSDDNLSCDYFWRYLNPAQQEAVAKYPFYGRVACFKGFDDESFAFNTRAEKSWFDRQFDLMQRLVRSGMDVLHTRRSRRRQVAALRMQCHVSSTDFRPSTRTCPSARSLSKFRSSRPMLTRLKRCLPSHLRPPVACGRSMATGARPAISASIRNLPITEIRIGKIGRFLKTRCKTRPSSKAS